MSMYLDKQDRTPLTQSDLRFAIETLTADLDTVWEENDPITARLETVIEGLKSLYSAREDENRAKTAKRYSKALDRARDWITSTFAIGDTFLVESLHKSKALATNLAQELECEGIVELFNLEEVPMFRRVK